MNLLITPQTKDEFSSYYTFRWSMLRAPWQQPEGSEKDELEAQAVHRMIIDEDTSHVLAVGRLHFVDQFNAQIRYVAVADNQQGKGLGRKIIESLEQAAVERGVTCICLQAREVSLSFYKAIGYEYVEKTHLLYDEIQHHLMTKSFHADESSESNLLTELQSTWHSTIPLSQAMNIKACHYTQTTLITSCDQQFNKNLHNTMFAGSIYTLATLTGWGWVYLQLAQLDIEADIVLAEADIKYLKPVAGAGHAIVSSEQVTGDLTPLTRQRHGKMNITVHVHCGDTVCAIFKGKYVAIAPKKHLNKD